MTCASLIDLAYRYPNLYEVRLIPTKKDIAFVEFLDEGSATVAKDALHNYKLDGENKIKVSFCASISSRTLLNGRADYLRKEMMSFSQSPCIFRLYVARCINIIYHCNLPGSLSLSSD